jgi:hypothetical protein
MMPSRIPFNTIDAMLSGKLKTERNYPDRFYDYPEVVQQTLISFYEVWKFPEAAVPTKRQKNNYQLWITDLTKIEDICSTQKNVRRALEIALDKYKSYSKQYQFIVWRPLLPAMEKLLIGAMMQIKDDEIEIEENKAEVVEVASLDERQKALKDLKSSLKKD